MTLDIPKIKMSHPTYIVGGWVRDKILNKRSKPKDIDLCMVAPNYEAMRDAVLKAGGEIFLDSPQYLTLRCKIPELGAVDVALARRDGTYSDGRRPDETFIATSIEDDLARRDFTCNALAVNVDNGYIVDLFGGVSDLESFQLKTVGIAYDRFEEDYLRLFRALRFAVTKQFDISPEVDECLRNKDLCGGIRNISRERIREEMTKAFVYNTFVTVRYLNEYPNLLYWMVEKGVSLQPTLKQQNK